MNLNLFRETTLRTYNQDLVQGMYALSKGFSETTLSSSLPIKAPRPEREAGRIVSAR